MSEFISGIFWGIAIVAIFQCGFAGIEWYRRRIMSKMYPGGILKIELDQASYPETNLQLAKLHRERPDMAIIPNGKKW